jgi:hypothetical protein
MRSCDGVAMTNGTGIPIRVVVQRRRVVLKIVLPILATKRYRRFLIRGPVASRRRLVEMKMSR